MRDDITLALKAFYSVEFSLHLLEVGLQLVFPGIEALTLHVKVTENIRKLVKDIQGIVDGIIDFHRTPGLQGRRLVCRVDVGRGSFPVPRSRSRRWSLVPGPARRSSGFAPWLSSLVPSMEQTCWAPGCVRRSVS